MLSYTDTYSYQLHDLKYSLRYEGRIAYVILDRATFISDLKYSLRYESRPKC